MGNRWERVGSAVLLAVCVGYLVVASQLPSESPNVSDVGPRLYPLIIGAIMVVLSASWLVKSLRQPADGSKDEDGAATAWWRVAALVLVSALFPVAMRPFGFVVTASLFLFTSILIVTWERPKVKRLIWVAALSVLSAIVLKWLFSDVLSIYLP